MGLLFRNSTEVRRSCVDRDLNCGRELVTWSCVETETWLWPIFGSTNLTVFAVTERSVSISLWWKIEQQSIAVLHTTLFSRQCHCSYSHYICALLPTVHCSTIYTINTTTHSCWPSHYVVTVLQCAQCHHLLNCTATHLGFFQRFITVRPKVCRHWQVWEIRQSHNPCYHLILFWFPLDSVTELTCWLSLCAVKYYLKKPVNTSIVTVVISAAYCCLKC